MSPSRLAVALLAVVLSSSGSVAAGERSGTAATRIVFTASVVGNTQIYSTTPDGQKVAQLTHARAPASAPIVSPDGRYVMFTRLARPYVMRADGRDVRRLPVGPTSWGFSWHPDSKRLVYADNEQIHEIGVDATRSRLLVRDLEWQLGYPLWSPDGKRLAYVKLGDLVIRAGGERTVVRRVGNPVAWSPDGKWMVCIWVEDDLQTRISLIRADGKQRISVGPGRAPSWSPDGRRLAFLTGFSNLEVFDLRTGGRRTLSTRASGSALDWSPRGAEIAFYSTAGGPGLRLVAVNLAGRLRALDLRSPFDGASLVWTPAPRGLRYRPPEPLAVGTATELRLRASVQELAVDGDRVAYRVCQTIESWRPGNVSVTTVREEETFLCRESPLAMYSLAVAGSRVGWGAHDGGITVERNWLSVADLRVPGTETIVASGGPRSAFMDVKRAGHIVGDGALLAFSTWAYCDGSASDDCASRPSRPVSQTIWRVREQSWPEPCPVLAGTWSTAPRVVGGRCQRLRVEPGPLVPFDADGGRILAGGDNATLVLDEDGRELLAIPVSGASGELSGNDLVLLRERELRHYDAGTGRLLRTFPLPLASGGVPCGKQCVDEAVTLEDLGRGLVVYRADGHAWLLRLSDGATTSVGLSIAARFGDKGLFFAYEGSAPWYGRIRLIPFDRLPLR